MRIEVDASGNKVVIRVVFNEKLSGDVPNIEIAFGESEYDSYSGKLVDSNIVEYNLGTIQRIVKNEDKSKWPKLFEKEGISSLID